MISVRHLAATGIAVASLLLVNCSHQPESLPPTLSIAIKPDQPGFASGGPTPAGLDVSLGRFIAKDLEYQNPAFTLITSAQRDGVIPGGGANLVIATYSITPARQNIEDFAGPYLKTTQALLIRDADLPAYGSPASLIGRRVCTVTGSTSSSYNLPGSPSVTTKSQYSECVTGVLNGDFDAVFTDTLILYGYEQANKGLKVVLAGDVGTNQYYGVALAPHHHALCEKIDQAIQKYIDTQWAAEFQTDFPHAVEAYSGAGSDTRTWQSVFRVTPDEIAAQSCKS